MGKGDVTELKLVVRKLTTDIDKLIAANSIQLTIQKEQNKKIDKLLDSLPDLAVVKHDIARLVDRVAYLEDSLVKSGTLQQVISVTDQVKDIRSMVLKIALVVFTAVVGAIGTLIIER